MKIENKILYEKLDDDERSIFENARHTVIREMEAIQWHDAESCVVFLIDAIRQISKMQTFALLNTEIKIRDIKKVKKNDGEI